MRVERLALHDFKSYQDLDLDLSGVSLASVVGPNGAGKSTILEAITYALYGSDGARNLDTYIRKGVEECRVALTFTVGGLRYRLTRTYSNRNKGKSTLELCREEGGLWVAEGTQVRETEQRVTAILAVDQATLRLTSVISQEDAGSFFKLQAAQRLEGIGRILQLDTIYEPIRAFMKNEADVHKAALEVARRDVERLEATADRLSDLTFDQASADAEVRQLQAELNEAQNAFDDAQQSLHEAQQDAAGIEATQTRLDELQSHKRALERRHAMLGAEMEGLRTRTSQRDPLTEELGKREHMQEFLGQCEKRREEARKVAEQRALLDADIRSETLAAEDIGRQGKNLNAMLAAEQQALVDVTHRIAAITGTETPVCDRCGQDIREESLDRTLKQLTTERDERAEMVAAYERDRDGLRTRYEAQGIKVSQLKVARDSLPVVRYDAEDHDRAKRRLAELDTIPAKLAEIAALQERLDACHLEAAEVGEQLRAPDFLAMISIAEKAVAESEGKGAAVREVKLQVEMRHGTLVGCRGLLSTAEKAAARLEGEIAALVDVPAQLEQAKADATVHARECADYDLLKTAFGKAGVPALIIQNVLLALEIQVNELLGLYDGGLALRFENEKENKDGSSRVSLEILVFDGADWRAFETFSGGEKYRVASAMRLGLARLLAHRSGARVETLLVDEPEGLDATGRAHLATILEHMSGDFGLCLLLTHYVDLQDALPSQIRVSRGEDGLSRAEVAA